MTEFLAKLSGEEIIFLTAVIGGVLISTVAILATQWRRVRIAEIEATLKQQMLDRGMSPAEIEQVMHASKEVASGVTSTGIEAYDKATLAQQMVENGYQGEDIERVLKAYQPDAGRQADKPTVTQA